MPKIILDGRNMTTIQSAHDEIARMLHLPSYYGKNLDALFDVLSTTHERTEIALTHSEEMLNKLESYGARLLMTFFDAASDNGRIEFNIVKDDPK